MTKRCKGCRSYLAVAPGQPCPVCHTVSKPDKKAKHHPPPPYDGRYGYPLQPPAYAGHYAPPPEYGGPRPSPPAVYGGNGYGRPNPQVLPPPTAYGGGYHGAQPHVPPPPPVYDRPKPQAPEVPAGSDQGAPRAQKRALLCGVTYKGHRKMLEASVNNVRSMHQLLLKLGFLNTSIRILTEEKTDPARIPTKQNMQTAMQWLIKGCKPGDSLVFYYAGHGSHVADKDGDEKDGFDEALCPVDYSTAGMIMDDEINATIVAPLPQGVVLHSIIDTCFSGTLLDLPFLCRINQDGFYRWENHYLSQVSSYKGTRGGKAICISACDDHQNSADTSAFTGSSIGALTYSFIQAVQIMGKLTYGDLLEAMRKKVVEAQKLQGINATFASSQSQEPQLSSSTRFEIYSELFTL